MRHAVTNTEPLFTPSFADLIAGVERVYRIEPGALAGNLATQRWVEARRVAMWLAVQQMGAETDWLAERFGRDVPTVSRSLEAIRLRVRQDRDFAERVDQVWRRAERMAREFDTRAPWQQIGSCRYPTPTAQRLASQARCYAARGAGPVSIARWLDVPRDVVDALLGQNDRIGVS